MRTGISTGLDVRHEYTYELSFWGLRLAVVLSNLCTDATIQLYIYILSIFLNPLNEYLHIIFICIYIYDIHIFINDKTSLPIVHPKTKFLLVVEALGYEQHIYIFVIWVCPQVCTVRICVFNVCFVCVHISKYILTTEKVYIYICIYRDVGDWWTIHNRLHLTGAKPTMCPKRYKEEAARPSRERHICHQVSPARTTSKDIWDQNIECEVLGWGWLVCSHILFQ